MSYIRYHVKHPIIQSRVLYFMSYGMGCKLIARESSRFFVGIRNRESVGAAIFMEYCRDEFTALVKSVEWTRRGPNEKLVEKSLPDRTSSLLGNSCGRVRRGNKCFRSSSNPRRNDRRSQIHSRISIFRIALSTAPARPRSPAEENEKMS